MVANFDAQDFNDEESLTDQETTLLLVTSWASLAASITHKSLTCTSLDGKNLNDLKMFQEEIIFSTAAHDDYLEFTNKDDVFFRNELCVPFSTHLFPCHSQNLIEDVFPASTLPEKLYDFVSPLSQFVAGKISAPLPACFKQVPKWSLYEKDVKYLDWLQFHLPVLYKVVWSSLQDMHSCFLLDAICTICGELKPPNIRPRDYALALTCLKENDCISSVIEPNSDADDLASVLLMVGIFILLGFCFLARMHLLASLGCYCPPSCLLKVPWKLCCSVMSSIPRYRQSPHLLFAMKNLELETTFL